MRIIKNVFIILILSLFCVSCSGFKMKKKSSSGDEFLIQKKDPLVLPPDYSKLPSPDQKKISEEDDNEQTQIEMVFKNDNTNEKENKNSEKSDSILEKSILKKIKKQ